MKKYLCLIILIFASCSAYQKIEGGLSPVFLEGRDLSQKLENLPFKHSWVEDQQAARTYGSVFLSDFRSDLINPDLWTESASPIITSAEDYKAESDSILSYFKDQLLKELKSVPDAKFKVVDSIQPDSIALKLAITEIEFAHPVSNAASLVSPIPGTGALLNAVSEPYIAFAATFSDPNDQSRLLATVADKRFPPSRIIDFNKFTASSSLREIVSDWANELAQAIQKGQFSEVEGRSRFSLTFW